MAYPRTKSIFCGGKRFRASISLVMNVDSSAYENYIFILDLHCSLL